LNGIKRLDTILFPGRPGLRPFKFASDAIGNKDSYQNSTVIAGAPSAGSEIHFCFLPMGIDLKMYN
ncbi:hypothetical protein ACFLU6_07645, partial [Acidobacteriota bacterium]